MTAEAKNTIGRRIFDGIQVAVVAIVFFVGISAAVQSVAQPKKSEFVQQTVDWKGNDFEILEDNKHHVICYTFRLNQLEPACVPDPRYMKGSK